MRFLGFIFYLCYQLLILAIVLLIPQNASFFSDCSFSINSGLGGDIVHLFISGTGVGVKNKMSPLGLSVRVESKDHWTFVSRTLNNQYLGILTSDLVLLLGIGLLI